MFRRFTVVLTACTLPVGAFAASIYQPTVDITFSQTERQSVWGPGAAKELVGSEFVGAEWDVSQNTGEIIGGVSTTTVPDITFSTRLATWNACRNSIFSRICGSRPRDGSFDITLDTRTGAEGLLETSGKAGFDFNYSLSAGSYASTAEFDVTAHIPDAVKAGETVQINSASTFKDGSIDVNSPNASASIDAVLKIDSSAEGTGCLIGFGCASGRTDILTVDEDRELISVDPFAIEYFSGFLPNGVGLTTNLLAQEVSLKLAVINGVPTVYVDGPGIPPPENLGAAATIDLAAARIVDPTFMETGGKVGNALEVNAESTFLELFADLDSLFGLPGGFGVGAGPLGVQLDAYDFDAGPTLGFFQDLKLEPVLMADLNFSRPVEIAGQLVSTFTGAWDSLPEIALFEDTVVTPNFFLDATINSVTGIQFGLSLVMEFLKANLSLSAFDISLLNLSLGPVFAERLDFNPDFAQISLFDQSFAATGFNTIQADPFLLNVQEKVNVVPVPPALPLLAAAIGALAVLRRRSITT